MPSTDPALANLRITCSDCGKPMVPRTNRDNGSEFLGCSGYPKCTATQPLPAYVAMIRQGASTLPGFD